MAHQIFEDRRMFYAGATPWHALGVAIPSNATWEQIANLFPPVVERPIMAAGGVMLPDMKALFDSADQRYLATVGADYYTIQPETIATAITAAALESGAVFHTGGHLGERGQRGWLLGELPEMARTVSGDNSPIRAYFLGTWGHDGRTPVSLANVATRVVCQNTVSAALRERGAFKVSIRHTSGAEMKIDDAIATFSALRASQGELIEIAETAAATRITRDTVRDALAALFPESPEQSDAQNDRAIASQAKVLDILAGPTVSAANRGTAWGLMQAASEFAEHLSARKLSDAQRQIDAIASRQIDAIGDISAVYATIGKVAGLDLAA